MTDRSGAEQLQELLPQASVVKAFNTVFATKQADPVTDGMPLGGFFAGNDETAKAEVAELLSAMGFRRSTPGISVRPGPWSTRPSSTSP